MSDEQAAIKDDWQTNLVELDEIVREIDEFSAMILGDKTVLLDEEEEEEELPALIHFIAELKKEKKNKSWEKLEDFASKAKENLKLLEETQQTKQYKKLIDRSIFGKLPKNTAQLGTQTMEIMGQIPEVIKIIIDSVECLLIDIRLKLGFTTVKLEREILDIKHQLELLEEEINAHTRTKKPLFGSEQLVYVQAYRESYLNSIEKAQELVKKGIKIHSKAFNYAYEKYLSKINYYKKSPAFDDVIKENSKKIEDTVRKWPIDGFKVFMDAQKFVRTIEDRMSDTKQSFIQQLKMELEADIDSHIQELKKLSALEEVVGKTAYEKINAALESTITTVQEVANKIDVVASDPHEQLITNSKVVQDATALSNLVYEATYGSMKEEMDELVKRIKPSKTSKKLLKEIEKTISNSLNPENLAEVIESIPALLEYKKTSELLFKELAVDVNNIQEKFIKQVKKINENFSSTNQIAVPSKDDIVELKIIDPKDLSKLEQAEQYLKTILLTVAKGLNSMEQKISEGIGIDVNTKIEAVLSKLKRPSYQLTVKKADSTMRKLARYAKNLNKDAGKALDNFAKDLKKFVVTSEALKTFQSSLKKIAKEAKSNKINLSEITIRLEKIIEEYVSKLSKTLQEHSDEIALVLKDKAQANFVEGMTLENFDLKHDEFVKNIDLEAALEHQKEEFEELTCKKCDGKIVSQKEEFNEMLGFNVLKVRCENGHDDNIIGFEPKKKEKPQEFKCSKKSCDEKPSIIENVELYTKDDLIITAVCPKRHKTEFVIKE